MVDLKKICEEIIRKNKVEITYICESKTVYTIDYSPKTFDSPMLWVIDKKTGEVSRIDGFDQYRQFIKSLPDDEEEKEIKIEDLFKKAVS